jgi:hypothetical protein
MKEGEAGDDTISIPTGSKASSASCIATSICSASAENNSDNPHFFVLVSKIDPTSTPLVFFPYPASLAIERACPPGYEGDRI